MVAGAVIAAAVIAAAFIARSSEKRQLRMLGGLRRNAEQQAQSMARLGEALNAAMRQIEGLSRPWRPGRTACAAAWTSAWS